MMKRPGTAALAVLSAIGASASAQNSAPGAGGELAVPQWTVEFRPSVWYVAPGGEMRLPGLSAAPEDLDVAVLSLDKPRLSPLVELHVRQGRWRFSAGGFSYSIDQLGPALATGEIGDVSFVAGDLVQSRLEFSCFEGTVGYRVVEEAMNPADGVHALVFSLDLVGGARAYDLSATVERPGISRSSDQEFFAEPLVGVKLNAELYDRFTVELHSEIGFQPVGDRTSWSWDVMVGGTWRPIENVGVRLGFRQLLFDLKSGSDAQQFKFGGGMAGLYGGLELKF